MSGSAQEWLDLEASLLGSFSARARGFLGTEFALSTENGAGFGTLRIEGSDGSSFETEGFSARLSDPVFGVVEEGGVGSSGYRIEYGDATCEVEVSLFRNSASARSEDGSVAARVSGGISNRRYEIAFERGSLPVAILVLSRLAAARRRAFRAG